MNVPAALFHRLQVVRQDVPVFVVINAQDEAVLLSELRIGEHHRAQGDLEQPL